jgi:hypothetical protein
VGDPLVVGLGARGPEHDVFHPVGGRPAGRTAALEPDAPRGAAVGDDLVAQGEQVVPGLRDLVAGLVEVVLRVPDHRLEVDVGREAPVLALVLGQADVVRAEQILELADVEAEVLERHDRPGLGLSGDTTRLGHERDVERLAFRTDRKLLLELAGRLDLDVVVGVDVVVHHGLDGFGLLRLHGVEDVDGACVLLAVAAALGAATTAVIIVIITAARRGDEGQGDAECQKGPPPPLGLSFHGISP